MQPRSTTLRLALAALGFLIVPAVAAAGSVAVATTADAAGPPRGVRTYGPSAERVEPPRLDGDRRPAGAERLLSSGTRISGTPMAGGVNTFALTPDGATVVYLADQDTAGLYELYSVPVDGSATATKISAGLTFGAGDSGVLSFVVSPDGQQVAFLADAVLGAGANDLYSAPVDGSSSSVRLSGASQAPVSAVGIAPDGVTAAFLGTDAGSGAFEVFRATLGSAASGVRLSDAATGNPNGNVVYADFSPDSATLLYAADGGADEVYQWYSVPLSAGGPGSDVRLSNVISFVNLGEITPDSSTLVYTGDQNTITVLDLYSVPLGGGAATRLTPSMAGTGVTALQIGPDGQRVAYLADQIADGVVELFGARPGIAGSGARLNTPLSGTQAVDAVAFAPDSVTVLYESDENAAGTFDLMSVPADASVAPNTLDAYPPPRSVGIFLGLGIPVVARRAVYPVVGPSSTNVFSVRYDGTATANRVNDTLASGDTVAAAYVPNSATRLMAWGVGVPGLTDKLYVGPVRSDLGPQQVNTTATSGSLGVLAFEVASDEVRVVFLQDQDTVGKAELYSVELDSDGDTVGNASDNCPFVFNSGQGPVRFNQTVLAADDMTFTWASARDTRYVRGPLGSVSTLAVDDSGLLFEADRLTDASVPASGEGFYYLFARDCPGRSYQTGPGAEPGRDSAGLP